MVTAGIFLLIVVLLVVHPRIQERRERELAERLARLHEKGAVDAAVDRAMAETRGESSTLRTLRRFVWPFLFR
jgi:hypothetical protein